MDTFLNDLKSGKFANMVKEEIRGETLQDSQQVFNVLRPLYGKTADTETMYCIFLNSKNMVLSIEMVSEGTLTAASVYPREIIKRALSAKAAAVIMAHNHPSGDPQPSPEDRAITRQVVIACRSVGITLHEHIVVGNTTYYSFADNLYINRFNREYEAFINNH